MRTFGVLIDGLYLSRYQGHKPVFTPDARRAMTYGYISAWELAYWFQVQYEVQAFAMELDYVD